MMKYELMIQLNCFLIFAKPSGWGEGSVLLLHENNNPAAPDLFPAQETHQWYEIIGCWIIFFLLCFFFLRYVKSTGFQQQPESLLFSEICFFVTPKKMRSRCLQLFFTLLVYLCLVHFFCKKSLNYSNLPPPPPPLLQFEIVSQHLVFANCIPLILKFFNQNIMSYISAKNRYGRCEFRRARLRCRKQRCCSPLNRDPNVK